MTEATILASLQRAEMVTTRTEGGLVLPSVAYSLADGFLGHIVLNPNAADSMGATAYPFRMIPEITHLSMALDGSMISRIEGADSPDGVTPAMTIIQYHRDGRWMVQILPYLLAEGMMVWDVDPKHYDETDHPESIGHLVRHLAVPAAADRSAHPIFDEIPTVEDQFSFCGLLLIEIGDALEIVLGERT